MYKLFISLEGAFQTVLHQYSHRPPVPTLQPSNSLTYHNFHIKLVHQKKNFNLMNFSRLLWVTPMAISQLKILIDSLLNSQSSQRKSMPGLRVIQQGETESIQAAQQIYSIYKIGQTSEKAVFIILIISQVIIIHKDLLGPQKSWAVQLQEICNQRMCVQLPKCISCLQRLQSFISGIVYIDLLEFVYKVKPSQFCKVCQSLAREKQLMCSYCGQTSQLWICMICSTIGCGRYKKAHAHQHFVLSKHSIVMNVSDQKIWDYLSDSYVHRIVRSEDNQVLNLDYNLNEQQEKSQVLMRQFCYTISDQLEQQREYFQRKLRDQEEHFVNHKKALLEAHTNQREIYQNLGRKAKLLKEQQDKIETKLRQKEEKIAELQAQIDFYQKANSQFGQSGQTMSQSQRAELGRLTQIETQFKKDIQFLLNKFQ